MAKLPLNAYLQEVEQMLNREARQEAIGHCKYILETFPKHIGVYRLLGRAYLALVNRTKLPTCIGVSSAPSQMTATPIFI